MLMMGSRGENARDILSMPSHLRQDQVNDLLRT